MVQQQTALVAAQWWASSTTANLFPGTILLDGSGGALATATYVPLQPQFPVENAYKGWFVAPSGAVLPYDLPSSPALNQEYADGNLPWDLDLVSDSNGNAFAVYPVAPASSPIAVSFNLASGLLNWAYQGTPGNPMKIIDASVDGGLTAKVTDSSASDTALRIDATGQLTYSVNWNAKQIDYNFGAFWTGFDVSTGAVQYAAFDPQEATGSATRVKGNPQHNGTSDPGLVLVATQDCHKTNGAPHPLIARYPTYRLRKPDDLTQTPVKNYTVFEHIAAIHTNCGVGNYLNLSPCFYVDGSARAPYNSFEDEISTGISGGAFTNSQFFLYGVPTETRLWGVKTIYRTLQSGAFAAKRPWNEVAATPSQIPLIDGQVDPWLAPWDGQAQTCDSSYSTYFPEF